MILSLNTLLPVFEIYTNLILLKFAVFYLNVTFLAFMSLHVFEINSLLPKYSVSLSK